MNDSIAELDEEIETFRPSAAIDPARLDYLWTLAERMARSTLVPESLRTIGNKNNKKDLPHEAIVANVFAVVEQADRWNISPWALLACAAIVHGKLGFEGKVISAVLKSRYGIDLEYEWTGEGENRKIIVSGRKPGSEKTLTVEGSVKDWRTNGDGSPWRPSTFDKMLAYRGAREFARLHEPSAILGVLGDDEILAIGMERQAQLARDITPSLTDRFGGGRSDGFSPDNVKQIASNSQVPMERIDPSTGEIIESEVQRESTAKTTSTANAASAKPASSDAGRGGESSDKDSRPTNSNSSSSATPPNDDEQADRREATPQRLSANQIKKYASWLARMGDVEKVEKASSEYMKEIGGAPAKGSPDYDLMVSIYTQQKKRAAGEIDAEGLMDAIHAEIEKSFGLDKFPGDL